MHTEVFIVESSWCEDHVMRRAPGSWYKLHALHAIEELQVEQFLQSFSIVFTLYELLTQEVIAGSGFLFRLFCCKITKGFKQRVGRVWSFESGSCVRTPTTCLQSLFKSYDRRSFTMNCIIKVPRFKQRCLELSEFDSLSGMFLIFKSLNVALFTF